MAAPADRALGPVRAAAGDIARLRAADGGPQREEFLRVAYALDSAVRRLLRDDPAVELDLRLRALAPDEIDSDEVIAELRRQDRVSLEFAAGFHELIGARAQVRAGGAPTPADTALLLRLVDRVEVEAARTPAGATPHTVPLPGIDEPTLLAPATPVPPPDRVRRRGPVIGAILLVLLLLAGIAWWRSGRNDAEFAEGVSRFRSGDFAGAEERIRRVVEDDPADPTPRLYLARIYRRAGQRDRAAQEIRAGLAHAPEDAGLHQELGLLLLDAGQPTAAAERFRVAVELNPGGAESWIGLVQALRTSGRADAAERVIARAPAEVRALLSRAED